MEHPHLEPPVPHFVRIHFSILYPTTNFINRIAMSQNPPLRRRNNSFPHRGLCGVGEIRAAQGGVTARVQDYARDAPTAAGPAGIRGRRDGLGAGGGQGWNARNQGGL